MLSICNGWEFVPEWFEGFAMGEGSGETVRIPHNVQPMPLHYSDSDAYQMICGYRRKLFVSAKGTVRIKKQTVDIIL